MAQPSFETDLLRMIAAELLFSVGMQAAREMHGKSYFALGQVEKAAIDQLVQMQIGANYQAITPELLRGQAQQGTGFPIPAKS